MIEFVDDVARVVSSVVFLFVAIRWSTSTAWWRWWDTRALFVLFVVLALMTALAVAGSTGRIPVGWKPWIDAAAWVLVAGSGLFLAVGYEREQWMLRRRIPPHHEPDTFR